MNNPGVFQMDIGVIHRQAGEICVHGNALRMLQCAVHRNIAIGVRMAAEFLQMQSREQERIQVDILDGDFSVQIVRLSKRQSATARYFSAGHGRAQFEMRGGGI